MSDNGHNHKKSISLDPENSPAGAVERVSLAEIHSPGFDSYDAATALAEMRDMRQVIENRMKNPSQYSARGAKGEIDIIKAPGEIQDFENYPKIGPTLQQNISEILKHANNPHKPNSRAYGKFVQNAIQAATESITASVAGYPGATAWVTATTKSPGPGFFMLGTLGGNTFYGTLKDNPVSQLRHHAAQARANAASKPIPRHMKLHYILTRMHRLQRPFAPIGGQTAPARGMQNGASKLMISPRPSRDISLIPLAPIGHEGAANHFGPRAALRKGRVTAPTLAGGSHSPITHAGTGHTAPDAKHPRHQSEEGGGQTAPHTAQAAPAIPSDFAFEQALNDYFFRQSRLPPGGAPAFDPRMTPAWIGL